MSLTWTKMQTELITSNFSSPLKNIPINDQGQGIQADRPEFEYWFYHLECHAFLCKLGSLQNEVGEVAEKINVHKKFSNLCQHSEHTVEIYWLYYYFYLQKGSEEREIPGKGMVNVGEMRVGQGKL